MQYEIKHTPTKEETGTSTYTVICHDSGATAFMLAINKEIKRMEAERIRQLNKGLKEGIRATPHQSMHKVENEFSFDNFHLDDVFAAGESLSRQRIEVECDFQGSMLEINPEFMEEFEQAVMEKTAE